MRFIRILSWIIAFQAVIYSCQKAPDASVENPKTNWWTADDRALIISELNRTTNELRQEIADLSDRQWYFKERADRWSIAEILEHLEMQNQLHYREITIQANSPQHLKYRSITMGKDDYFTRYATDTIKGQSQWFLQPLGRYNSKPEGETAFYTARNALKNWVEETEIDLRKQFTFRTPVEGRDISELRIGQVRDLHQLLLTGIAHTDRHLRQIRTIKQHPDFPE